MAQNPLPEKRARRMDRPARRNKEMFARQKMLVRGKTPKNRSEPRREGGGGLQKTLRETLRGGDRESRAELITRSETGCAGKTTPTGRRTTRRSSDADATVAREKNKKKRTPLTHKELAADRCKALRASASGKPRRSRASARRLGAGLRKWSTCSKMGGGDKSGGQLRLCEKSDGGAKNRHHRTPKEATSQGGFNTGGGGFPPVDFSFRVQGPYRQGSPRRWELVRSRQQREKNPRPESVGSQKKNGVREKG